jgi:hypothetical protein
MKPEVKSKWLEALRSGEYTQTTHSLKSGDKFCCLGVLCDLHAKETGEAWQLMPIPKWWKNCPEFSTYFGVQTQPPIEVTQWAGFEKSGVLYETLIDMNDGQGKSFSEIADYIEGNL